MNSNDKELFFQALQRQNERAAEMKMPDDMEQRVLEHIRTPRRAFRPYPIVAAVAASIALLVLFSTVNDNTPEQPMAQQQEKQSVELGDSIVKKNVPEEKPHIAEAQNPKSQNTRHKKRRKAKEIDTEAQEIPDTLGDGIWQRRENVLLALQMLAACEANGEQRQRNAVIEAAFLSTPRPHELQLVVSETGDYLVVADGQQPAVIEL